MKDRGARNRIRPAALKHGDRLVVEAHTVVFVRRAGRVCVFRTENGDTCTLSDRDVMRVCVKGEK